LGLEGSDELKAFNKKPIVQNLCCTTDVEVIRNTLITPSSLDKLHQKPSAAMGNPSCP
jgi:hypothetical protein